MSEAQTGRLVAARHALVTQRLRQRRDDLGLTQKQIVTRLARCGLQTTNRALSGLEHGSGLDVAKLPELARALDCTVTYLIGLTDDPQSWQPTAPIPSLGPGGQAPNWSPPVEQPAPSSDSSPAPLILGELIPERRVHGRGSVDH
jgi:transcriptional regulator with XRE-family HTH domain